jgi:hypothetical protein
MQHLVRRVSGVPRAYRQAGRKTRMPRSDCCSGLPRPVSGPLFEFGPDAELTGPQAVALHCEQEDARAKHAARIGGGLELGQILFGMPTCAESARSLPGSSRGQPERRPSDDGSPIRGLDWTQKYPPIARAVAAVGARQAYLDGELCGVGPDGITSFSMIQLASDAGNAAGLVFFLFDRRRRSLARPGDRCIGEVSEYRRAMRPAAPSAS